jgi:predicted deacylase
MAFLEMRAGERSPETPESRIYSKTRWVRVPPGKGGYFFPTAELGQQVGKGEQLGILVDPLTDRHTRIDADADGEVIGMAVAQIVLSGYALVHLGIAQD